MDIGLLFLRVTVGLMMLGHGFGKLSDLLAGEFGFPDPIGIGPLPSKILAVFAEFFCSLLVIVGFKTRLSAIPVAFTMFVAAFVVHFNDPWPKKEFALVYFCAFVTLALTGGGRYALDSLFGDKRRRPRN
jgi:putative oxidoreductase